MADAFDRDAVMALWWRPEPAAPPPGRCRFRRYGLFRGQVYLCDDYALPGEDWCAGHLDDHDPGCPTWITGVVPKGRGGGDFDHLPEPADDPDSPRLRERPIVLDAEQTARLRAAEREGAR